MKTLLQEDTDVLIRLFLAKQPRVSRNPEDFLLLHIDGCFDLSAHVSDVDTLDHN